MSRWTDGEAILPLLEMLRNFMLEIHLADTMTYVVDIAPERVIGRRAA